MSKMKINEALNLYGLHKNPEQLAKYDKAKDTFLVKAGMWAVLMSEEEGCNTFEGSSALPKLKSYLGVFLTWADIHPFTREMFDKLLAEEDGYNSPDIFRPDETYPDKRRTFLESVSKIKNPKSLVSFNYDNTGGMIVLEHHPDMVRLAFDRSNED